MATLVFRLRNVPEDEADDVRGLLDEASIEWYETSAGNWGIAMPGIWVVDSDDVRRTRDLIDDYQQVRSERLSEEADKASGFLVRCRERPLSVLAILVFCLFVLYVTINPFLQLVANSGS